MSYLEKDECFVFQTLIKLPTRISESDEVLQFLEATPDDLNPRAAQ